MKSFRPSVVLFFVLLVHSGCQEIVDPNCGGTDPLAQVVFYVELYNCDGELIKTFSSSEQDDFYDKVTSREIIHTCLYER